MPRTHRLGSPFSSWKLALVLAAFPLSAFAEESRTLECVAYGRPFITLKLTFPGSGPVLPQVYERGNIEYSIEKTVHDVFEDGKRSIVSSETREPMKLAIRVTEDFTKYSFEIDGDGGMTMNRVSAYGILIQVPLQAGEPSKVIISQKAFDPTRGAILWTPSSEIRDLNCRVKQAAPRPTN